MASDCAVCVRNDLGNFIPARVFRLTMGIVRAGIQLIAAAGPAGRKPIQAEAEIALTAYLSV